MQLRRAELPRDDVLAQRSAETARGVKGSNDAGAQAQRCPTESGAEMIDESELPSLTAHQQDVLRRFAWFQADLAEFRAAMTGVFEFQLQRGRRSAHTFFRMPEPGIAITREHIGNALEQKRLGKITERDLVNWATLLLLNDAYVLNPGDEDLIAEWLNDISLHLDGE